MYSIPYATYSCCCCLRGSLFTNKSSPVSYFAKSWGPSWGGSCFGLPSDMLTGPDLLMNDRAMRIRSLPGWLMFSPGTCRRSSSVRKLGLMLALSTFALAPLADDVLFDGFYAVSWEVRCQWTVVKTIFSNLHWSFERGWLEELAKIDSFGCASRHEQRYSWHDTAAELLLLLLWNE